MFPTPFGKAVAQSGLLPATAIAILASALRPRRYLHVTQPLAEELAEGAAQGAEVVGLDESEGLDGSRAG